MKVVVIGAGVVGVSTAYQLHVAGADVTLLERRPGPGEATSAGNGAILHPGLTEPWNAPGVLRTLVANIGREDSAVLLRLHALPGLLRWGMKFLRGATDERFRAGALRNARFALASQRELAALRARTGIGFHWFRRGMLMVFRDRGMFDEARRAADLAGSLGIESRGLDPTATVEVEPALADVQCAIAGGIFSPSCESGDPHAFCIELATWLRERGATLRYGDEVSGFVRRRGRVEGVELASGERVDAEHIVLAAGSEGVSLARRAGLALPIVPVKGYSLTLPRTDEDVTPRMPVGDALLHVVVNPLGPDRLRVAGTAEFAGFDASVRPARIANLTTLLAKLFPRYATAMRETDPRAWSGWRPMSADCLPLIGPTPIPGLWVNMGHGHAGWMLAAASGRLLADLVLGRETGTDPHDFAPARFQLESRRWH